MQDFKKLSRTKNIFNLQEGGAVLCPPVVKVVVILAFSIVIQNVVEKVQRPSYPMLSVWYFLPKKVFPVLANNQLVRGGPLSNASSLEHSTISYLTSLIIEDLKCSCRQHMNKINIFIFEIPALFARWDLKIMQSCSVFSHLQDKKGGNFKVITVISSNQMYSAYLP